VGERGAKEGGTREEIGRHTLEKMATPVNAGPAQVVQAIQAAFLGDSRTLYDGKRALVHQG